MIQGGILVSNGTDYQWAIPYISDGTSFQRAIPYIYEGGQWKILGAAGIPMIYWLDSNGQYMKNGSDYILVRQTY